MSNRIKALYLHNSISVPGGSVLGTVSIIPEKYKVVMTWEKDHVCLLDKKLVVRIPHAAVAFAIMMEENAPPSKGN